MSSKTKIWVLKLKEIITTVIFVILGIILIVLLFLIFTGKSKKNKMATNANTYSPGVYTASIVLSTNPVELAVTVDADKIKSISMINTSESVETMYPLIATSLDSIASQIIQNNSTENITYTPDSRYTSIVLINSINAALEKALN